MLRNKVEVRSRVAPSLRFEPGTIVVFDRGYADYDWFAVLDVDGLCFVTRLKENADYGVVERRPVPPGSAVRQDEIIFLYMIPPGWPRSAEIIPRWLRAYG